MVPYWTILYPAAIPTALVYNLNENFIKTELMSYLGWLCLSVSERLKHMTLVEVGRPEKVDN